MSGFESWMRFNFPSLVEEWEVEAYQHTTLKEWVGQLDWLVPIRKEDKQNTMGKGTSTGKRIMRRDINRAKKQIIKKITPKPPKTKIRIRRPK